jgi:hypothetical protein
MSAQVQQQAMQNMGYPQGYLNTNGQPQPAYNMPAPTVAASGHNQIQRYDGQQVVQQPAHPHAPATSSSLKRSGINVTTSTSNSAGSSDNEAEDEGELPTEGMVRPWEVLRGLADVAVQQDRIVRYDQTLLCTR